MRWVLTVLGLTAAICAACSRLSEEPPAAVPSPELEPAAQTETGLRWGTDLLDLYVQYQRTAATAWRAEGDALEKVRTKSGLSEVELDELDQVVDQFLSLRDRLAELPSPSEIEKVKPKAGRLPESLRRKMERMLQRAEEERREAEEVSTLKAQQGEAAVELLLSKESELRAARRDVVEGLLAVPRVGR